MIKNLQRQKWIWLDRFKLRKIINDRSVPIKMIIGAGNTTYDGWIRSDYPVFNVHHAWEWKFLFGKNKISNLLAEHVLEHFTEKQVKTLLKNSYKYLSEGGIFRIAVPDQFHVNKDYINYVKPFGIGPGAGTHRSFWNYVALSEIGKQIGFTVDLVEYWDEKGNFHSLDSRVDRGVIIRSKSRGFKCEIKDYSSLIIDLVK